MEEIPQLNLPMVRVGGLSLLSTCANVLDVLLYHMYACLTSMAESSNCSWSITCVDVLLHIGKPVRGCECACV